MPYSRLWTCDLVKFERLRLLEYEYNIFILVNNFVIYFEKFVYSVYNCNFVFKYMLIKGHTYIYINRYTHIYIYIYIGSIIKI